MSLLFAKRIRTMSCSSWKINIDSIGRRVSQFWNRKNDHDEPERRWSTKVWFYYNMFENCIWFEQRSIDLKDKSDWLRFEMPFHAKESGNKCRLSNWHKVARRCDVLSSTARSQRRHGPKLRVCGCRYSCKPMCLCEQRLSRERECKCEGVGANVSSDFRAGQCCAWVLFGSNKTTPSKNRRTTSRMTMLKWFEHDVPEVTSARTCAKRLNRRFFLPIQIETCLSLHWIKWLQNVAK